MAKLTFGIDSNVLGELIGVVIWLIIIDALLSWFLAPRDFPRSLTSTMLEPAYRVVRQILPAQSGFDFSPIILIVVLNILRALIL